MTVPRPTFPAGVGLGSLDEVLIQQFASSPSSFVPIPVLSLASAPLSVCSVFPEGYPSRSTASPECRLSLPTSPHVFLNRHSVSAATSPSSCQPPAGNPPALGGADCVRPLSPSWAGLSIRGNGLHPPLTLGLPSDGLLVTSGADSHFQSPSPSQAGGLDAQTWWILCLHQGLSSACPHPVYLRANQARARGVI